MKRKIRKFFRNLMSGFFVFILLLLAQIAIFVFFQFFLDDILLNAGVIESEFDFFIRLLIYFGVHLIEYTIATLIFFKIISKIEDPEFKIPWIVGMLLLPLLFSVLFLIFGNPRL